MTFTKFLCISLLFLTVSVIAMPRGKGATCVFYNDGIKEYEMGSGLCYEKCKEGYSGVGPLCWKKKGAGVYSRGVGKFPSECGIGLHMGDDNLCH
jgi:hypothetical protein